MKKQSATPTPTYGLIDSQRAKMTSASVNRGFDGGKKSKVVNVNIVVDTMGNLLAISVHVANIHDTKSGINPVKKAFQKYPTIQKFCGDDGYRKSFEESVLEQLGLGIDINASGVRDTARVLSVSTDKVISTLKKQHRQ